VAEWDDGWYNSKRRLPMEDKEVTEPGSHWQLRRETTMFGLSPVELIVIGGLAVLLFGSRLPPVGRSLHDSYMMYMLGMHDFDRGARYDTPPRPSVGDLLIAGLFIEVALLAFVLYDHFGR